MKFSATTWFGCAINLGFRAINKRNGQKVPKLLNKNKTNL